MGVSHVIIYVGIGTIPRGRARDPAGKAIPLTWEARRPRCRLYPLTDWGDRYIEWYAPTERFTEEEKRLLRAVCYFTHDRIDYSLRDIWRFAVFGHPDHRDGKLYCSEGVAELYLVVRDVDLSQLGAPWSVDPRTAYQAVRHPRGGFALWAKQTAPVTPVDAG